MLGLVRHWGTHGISKVALNRLLRPFTERNRLRNGTQTRQFDVATFAVAGAEANPGNYAGEQSAQTILPPACLLPHAGVWLGSTWGGGGAERICFVSVPDETFPVFDFFWAAEGHWPLEEGEETTKLTTARQTIRLCGYHHEEGPDLVSPHGGPDPRGSLQSSGYYVGTSKRLLSLNACLSDAQCWGRGRRCIDGRCWGFAGPRRTVFECGVETVCNLGSINGHFYGEGGKGNMGLFLLQVIRGAPWDCGQLRALPPQQHTTCGDSQACELMPAAHQEQHSNQAAEENGETLSLGKAVRCTYTPGITSQSSCTASLGLVPPDLPVGLYALCGCSSTDLRSKGRPCSSVIDFSVPIGTLKITGFEAPVAVSVAPLDARAGSPAAAEFTHAAAKEASAAAADVEPAGTAKAIAKNGAAASEDVEPNRVTGAGQSDTIDDTEPLQAVPAYRGHSTGFTRVALRLPRQASYPVTATDGVTAAGAAAAGDDAGVVAPGAVASAPGVGLCRCVVRVRPEEMRVLLLPKFVNVAPAAKAKAAEDTQATRQTTASAPAVATKGVRSFGEVPEVIVTLCGCRRGSTPLQCLGSTPVGLLQLRAEPELQRQQTVSETRQPEAAQQQLHLQHDQEPELHPERQPEEQPKQLQGKQQEEQQVAKKDDKAPQQPAQRQAQQEEAEGDFVSNVEQRRLQFIEERAANLPKAEGEEDGGDGGECRQHSDCLRGLGQCAGGRCHGFVPDLKGQRLLRCVEGYHCDAEKGDIPTVGNKQNFTVIAIGPQEECGTAVNLKPDSSIFNNVNKWVCSSTVSGSCELRFGVGRRLSRANTVEGVRLCGCPGLDLNGDGRPCNHMRDFPVPVGRVSVQECITNAHCADRQLAYCIKDHCAGFLVTAAAASLNAFACIRNQECTLENVAARGVTEALKVIPIAAHLRCGPEAALDPNFLPESAMPCVADVDGDGKCDVHLGVNHFLGTHRLCGCSGDNCDAPEDFGVELGLLNSVECVVHSDCPIHALCAKGECVTDALPPSLLAADPAPNSTSIPPVKHLQLHFNEDILFGRPGSSIVVQCLEPSIKWVITLPEGATDLSVLRYTPPLFPRAHRRPLQQPHLAGAAAGAAGVGGAAERQEESTGTSKWLLERQGQMLMVTPDEELTSLPQGNYTVSLEFGFVIDLTGNPCEGVGPLSFRIAKDGGCPLLYVTGFGTENGNCNGLYTPIDPVNGHAAWRGGEGNVFFIYYRQETAQEPGNWVVDTDLDESAFLGFADIALLQGPPRRSRGDGPPLPPSGLWHKWTGKKREEQPFAVFLCRQTPDHLPPSLVAVGPPYSEAPAPQKSDSADSVAQGPHLLQLDSASGLPSEPLVLIFNKPVTYGHWASLRLTPRGQRTPVAEWPADQEAGLRGGSLRVRRMQPQTPGAAGGISSRTSPASTDSSSSSNHLAGNLKPDEEELGVAELDVDVPLDAGQIYELTADLGAFTDLSYNPWGPLGPQTVLFEAAATHCLLKVGAEAAAAAAAAAEPDGPEAQAAAANETAYELQLAGSTAAGEIQGRQVPEGTRAAVHCSAGLSLPLDIMLETGSSSNAGDLQCVRGKWTGALSPCVPRCSPYPRLADAYDVEETHEAAEGISGAAVVVRCADTAAATTATTAGSNGGQHQQTLRCIGGRWEPLTLHCATMCPPLGPSLGPAYLVRLPPSIHADEEEEQEEAAADAAAAEGEERLVECAEPQTSSREQHEQEQQPLLQLLRCTEAGWEPPVTLSCKRSCRQPPLTPEGAELQGEGMHHGSVWTAQCKQGYGGPNGVFSMDFTCDDGQWVRDRSMGGAAAFVCSPLCPPLLLNPRAYTVTPVAAVSAEAAGGGAEVAAAAAVSVTCAPNSVLLGGPAEEILRCRGGMWGLRSISCAAGCTNPLEELGRHYALVQQQQQQRQLFQHGDTVDITCSEELQQRRRPAAAAAKTRQPHAITCVDGRWESMPYNHRQQQQQHDAEKKAAATTVAGSSNGVLLRCSATCSLPPLMSHFLVVSPRKTRRPGGLLASVWNENERLTIKCSPPFQPTLPLPSSPPPQQRHQELLQQQLQQLQCVDGEWKGHLKDDICVRPCPAGPGGLPEARWREWGVQCGEACSSSCGSCYNGKQEKHEEGVDCGGPFCEPCSSCSPVPLKQFVLQPKLYSTSLKQQQQQQQQQVEFPVEMTRHGSTINITCSSSHSLSLSVTCNNGTWTTGAAAATTALAAAAEDASNISAFAVACVQADLTASAASSSSSSMTAAAAPRAISAATAAAELLGDEDLLLSGAAAPASAHGQNPPLQWREEGLLRFGPPLLRLLQPEGTTAQQQQHQRLSPCMRELIAGVSRLLVGECGALAFGQSAFKVASFCKGTCSSNFRKELQEATECSRKTAAATATAASDGPSAVAAADQHLLQLFTELLEVLCSVQGSQHCFSLAGEAFALLQRLHRTPKQQLQQQLQQQVCPGSSGSACFSSNIRYISVLLQLREYIDVALPGTQPQQPQQPQQRPSAAGTAAKGLDDSSVGVGVRGLLTDLRRLPAVLSLLCSEADGRSCAIQVFAIAAADPFSALPQQAAAAEFCSSASEAPCLLEVYRLVGKELLRPHPQPDTQQQQQWQQHLLQQQVHPHDWALGTAMESIGRNFCLRSAEDKTCGALLVPQEATAAAAAAAAAGRLRDYEPVAAADLPFCRCPIAFVGDGECDNICNTAACGFDKGDCLAQRQPLLLPILELLQQQLPGLEEGPCFPFSLHFHCSQHECRDAIHKLQKQNGCCVGPQLELLRDLLYIDQQQQQQQRQQLVLLQKQAPEAVTPQLLFFVQSLWEELEGASGPFELYRSLAFIEADCKVIRMPLDRTCSRGLNRSVFAVDARIEGLNYEALASSSSSSSSRNDEGEELLRHVLRDAFAAALGLPAVDRLRKDDTSGLAAVLSRELQRQQAGAGAAESAGLPQQHQQKVLEPLLLHPIPLLLPAASFSLSPVFVPPSTVSIKPVAYASPGSSGSSSRRQQQHDLLRPEKGTWGLGRIEARDVSCSTNEGLSAPENVSVFEAYRLHSTAATNEHGSVITVECGRGYSAVAGWSPQELICQQGRWSPLSSAASGIAEASGGAAEAGGADARGGGQAGVMDILLCRKPCGPYEAADPSVLGPAFIASGVGEGHGDRRVVYCASGFVPAATVAATAAGATAAAAAAKTETLVCSNGVWSRRQLQCVKDIARMLEASPCSGALSLLPPSLKVDGVSTTHQPTESRGPPENLPLSQEVADALASTFQQAGVSLQLFRVGCARGFISSAVQRKKQLQQLQTQHQPQQQLQQQQQQHPFIYAACKDGKLLDLGSKEPLPMAAFASGEAAKALVQQLKLRLDSAPEAITSTSQTEEEAALPPPAAAIGAAGTAGDHQVFLDGDYPGDEPGAGGALKAAAAGASAGRGGASRASVIRSLAEVPPLLLGAALDCQRELRQEPPKPPKPVSDTLLVFSCLLLLFVFVVALLALWWVRARRRQQKAAKLQQQQEGDAAGPTTSDIGRDFLSGAEPDGQSLAGSSAAAAAAAATADPYRKPLPPQQLLHHSNTATAPPALYATAAYAGTSMPYLLEAAQQQQPPRPVHMSAAAPPVFPSEAVAAAATAGSADDNSLAFFAPVYYTGLTGDRGLVTLDGDSNSTAGAGAAAAEGEYQQMSYSNKQQQQQLLLLQQQQRQHRHQRTASASSPEGGPQAAAAGVGGYIAAGAAPQQQIVAAEVAAATAAAGWGPQEGRCLRVSHSTRESAQQQHQQRQQQRQRQPAISRTGNSYDEVGPAVVGESGTLSGGTSLISEEDELYPEDSASCMLMPACQRREVAAAAAATAAASSAAPRCRHKAGTVRQLSAAQSFNRGRHTHTSQFPGEGPHR
ncbi:sushi domain-containing protein / SCR repeat-containing protein, putative [Eimeria maxima]|uniref:Sushi domain-containing protein / SCR repeat-containing protein, putative n=1 Tax=Eimeria maxima TaxID=5804 RepID=U6M8D7_EIMMA|nr:sushi domain-containing protein / SCR repeat-containing protein, putative [Eimeria maxima]CDJ59328.1 sushi domain-containing protein / SCR repeat-containing protein, putative [Eimeria maxima]